jgi:hypothetical protein
MCFNKTGHVMTISFGEFSVPGSQKKLRMQRSCLIGWRL